MIYVFIDCCIFRFSFVAVHSFSTAGSEKFERMDDRRKGNFQREISSASEKFWRHCC